MANDGYDFLDQALAPLNDTGPSLVNGFVNHAPMVAEALVAMGQGAAALRWVNAHLRGTMSAEKPTDGLGSFDWADNWQEALGNSSHDLQWRAFFARELEAGDWRSVLDLWSLRLAPGLFAAATHGIIRVGHAVRALSVQDTLLRRRELSEGLALWAVAYQTLPEDRGHNGPLLSPALALAHVPLLPHEHRQNEGSITTALEQIHNVPDFAPVIGMIDLSENLGDLADAVASVFAQVFLEQTHSPLSAIVYTHSITTVSAILNISSHVSEETLRALLAYGWQAACGLYCAYGLSPYPGPGVMEGESEKEIAEKAVAHGDDHVIKLSEACLALYSRTGEQRFLMVPARARALLQSDLS